MNCPEPLVDIHCHLIPGIDDGAKSWDETLAMARMAVDDGIETIVVTPHQLGNFSHNRGPQIREKTAELQRVLDEHEIPLTVLPGADVRIEPEMVALLCRGEVLSLADRRKHVLLELPHELYFPLEGVLDQLHAHNMVGILSHPERNQGLLKDPRLIEPLVDRGCLMQVTAGSLMGTFGPPAQQFAEWMIQRRLVHFLSTDAHGPKSRRPLMQRAFWQVAELADEPFALDICCRNPAAVAEGRSVSVNRQVAGHKPKPREKSALSWFGWRKAG